MARSDHPRLPPPSPTLLIIAMLATSWFVMLKAKQRKALLDAIDLVLVTHSDDPDRFQFGRSDAERAILATAHGPAHAWVQNLRNRLASLVPRD